MDWDGSDNVVGTEDDDMHLSNGSPAINAGDDDAVPEDLLTDVDGDPRIVDCHVDMGADENTYIGEDCNNNGWSDGCDLAEGVSADCNTNDIPDECDAFAGGNFDVDEDVDLDDFRAFADSLDGPGQTPGYPTPACLPAYLDAFDFDSDNDVDLDDFAVFQQQFTGSQ